MDRESQFLDQMCTAGAAIAYPAVTALVFYGWWTAPLDNQSVLNLLYPNARLLLVVAMAVLAVMGIVYWRALARSRRPIEPPTHWRRHVWSPWRYAALVVPLLMLFMPFQWREMCAVVNYKPPVPEIPWDLGELADEPVKPDTTLDLKLLSEIIAAESSPQLWHGKHIETEGLLFARGPDSTQFQVARYRLSPPTRGPCVVRCISKQTLKDWGVRRQTWVRVRGQLSFRRDRSGKLECAILVTRLESARQPANPYLP